MPIIWIASNRRVYMPYSRRVSFWNDISTCSTGWSNSLIFVFKKMHSVEHCSTWRISIDIRQSPIYSTYLIITSIRNSVWSLNRAAEWRRRKCSPFDSRVFSFLNVRLSINKTRCKQRNVIYYEVLCNKHFNSIDSLSPKRSTRHPWLLYRINRSMISQC